MNLTDVCKDFPDFEPGQVWLAGAGPGRLSMVTLECCYAVKHADCIIYDALINPEILKWANRNTEQIFAGKRGGKPSAKQKDIIDMMIARARAGKKLLRLKGGDPMTFARGGEEALRLAEHNIPFRILPGITAGIGGLAAAGIPLTQRSSNTNVMFLTGHALTGEIPHTLNWQAVAQAADVMVWYMACKHFPEIADRLIKAGRKPEEPVAFVSNASLPEQEILITTLHKSGDTARHVKTPAVVAIGPIVELYEVLHKNFLPL